MVGTGATALDISQHDELQQSEGVIAGFAEEHRYV